MRAFAKNQFSKYIEPQSVSDLEDELYKYSIDEVQIPWADWDFDCVRHAYKHKLRGLLTALRYTEFVKKVEGGVFNAREIVYMSPSEMNPEGWQTAIDACQDLTPSDTTQEERYGEAACSSCLRRGQPAHNTVYSQLQTRSADEGLTTYFLCYNCGKRWRQS